MFESDAPDIYRGMNPAFVRKVWAKRRGSEPRPGRPPRPSKWTPERRAQVAEYLLAGLSAGQIALKMGVTANAIAGLVHADLELRAIGFQTNYAKKLREKSR